MENLKVNLLEIERQKINQIDEAIVKLLDLRFEKVIAIGIIKKQFKLPIFQIKREQEVLNRISNLSQNTEASMNIFRVIMQESKKIQERV
jgi:chorismate mutase